MVKNDLPWGLGLHFHACPHLAGAEHHVVKLGTGRDHRQRVLVLVDVKLADNWLNGRKGSQRRQAGSWRDSAGGAYILGG